MKLMELANQDFFDHNDPKQVKMMNDLDGFTASPNHYLKPETVEFLRGKYAKRSGTVPLYRAMVYDDLHEFEKQFNCAAVEGESFTYKRDKESSWTKSKKFALSFAEEGDLDERYTVVLFALVPIKDFLFDVDDLSKKDLEEIIIDLKQREVIVDKMDRKVKIFSIIDN